MPWRLNVNTKCCPERDRGRIKKQRRGRRLVTIRFEVAFFVQVILSHLVVLNTVYTLHPPPSNSRSNPPTTICIDLAMIERAGGTATTPKSRALIAKEYYSRKKETDQSFLLRKAEKERVRRANLSQVARDKRNESRRLKRAEMPEEVREQINAARRLKRQQGRVLNPNANGEPAVVVGISGVGGSGTATAAPAPTATAAPAPTATRRAWIWQEEQQQQQMRLGRQWNRRTWRRGEDTRRDVGGGVTLGNHSKRTEPSCASPRPREARPYCACGRRS
jgi:hypothetical protein